MHVVETYLSALWQIRGSGAAVPETSGYGPLANLFDAAGSRLSPRVRCITGLRQQGAGLPDAGLFTSDQFPRTADAEPRVGQLPSRGVMEVKSTAANVVTIANSAQVRGYLDRYGLVLVTNYRDFVLVEPGPNGEPRLLERYALAPSEAAFWQSSPKALTEQHGDRLLEYLTRALLHAAPLRAPRDVALLLASYARDARSRVEAQRDLPALAAVRQGLEQGLGIVFEGARGEHFFRSTLVQTLFYGVFSAWVLWHAESPDRTDRFTWRLAGAYLHLPVLQSLFSQLAQQARLRNLGLLEVLDWTDDALARVERAAFFTAFADDQAVQYFYEPFLEAFDPELRRQLGVWYTPREIVQYQVARVDEVLRTELGIADGLADPRVYVLDPCCGTGAYLVEVVRRIATTLRERGDDDLLATDLTQAIIDRVFGFELLPAPFVVAHLQIGLLLQQFGGVLQNEQRAAIYLTNALTGWEPPGPAQQRLLFPELESERDAARRVKREVPILVVLGNPPYYAFGGVATGEERNLIAPYKLGLRVVWGIRKYNLDELYVRFLRLAERRIAESTGRGIICYISNASYVGDPSFVVVRERLLQEFDTIWIDDLHGDSRETGKLTLEGDPDPSVFSTPQNREGIRLGTAIGLFVRRDNRADSPTVLFRDFWGENKREALLASLQSHLPAYQPVQPGRDARFNLRPFTIGANYRSWPTVIELCSIEPVSGLQEMRRGALMDFDQAALSNRMRQYYDPGTSYEAFAALGTGLTQQAGRYDPPAARRRIIAAESFDAANIRRYALYPMDHRWAYYSATRPLWNEPRPALVSQAWPGNSFFVTRMTAERPNEQIAAVVTNVLPDYHLLRPNVIAIPMRLRSNIAPAGLGGQASLFHEEQPRANLSKLARDYLTHLGLPDPDADQETAELLWFHALAICFSPVYDDEHGPAIRQNWPRIPLPTSADKLRASAQLGRQIAALLDPDTPVAGVTAGAVLPYLRELARLRRSDGTPVRPELGDLAVTAGWGYLQRRTVIMPGHGRVSEREMSEEEAAALGDGAAQIGTQTLDVWLNDQAQWRNVPMNVWEYRIGGYQVLKKWLSYRERTLLKRDMTPDEARTFTQIVRRIAALLLLEPQLDENYRAAMAPSSGL